MRRSTAAARTVLCGTVIRCARALSAAPMETIQRCMLRRAEQRGGTVWCVGQRVCGGGGGAEESEPIAKKIGPWPQMAAAGREG